MKSILVLLLTLVLATSAFAQEVEDEGRVGEDAE